MNDQFLTDLLNQISVSGREEPVQDVVKRHMKEYADCILDDAMGNVIYWDTRENKKTEESYALASAVSSVTGYTVQANQGVGGFKDWHQRSELAAPGITIEVGRTACPVEFSEYQEIWQQNKEVPALVLAQTLSK